MGTTFYGVNATLRDNQNPARPINPPDGYARRMVIYDEYVLTADLAAADKIELMEIPSGARVLGGTLKYGAMGGSCTVNVGWEASAEATPLEAAVATGFFSALAVSSAGASAFTAGTLTGLFKKFTSKVRVVIAENAVSSGATGLKFSLALDIAVD